VRTFYSEKWKYFDSLFQRVYYTCRCPWFLSKTSSKLSTVAFTESEGALGDNARSIITSSIWCPECTCRFTSGLTRYGTTLIYRSRISSGRLLYSKHGLWPSQIRNDLDAKDIIGLQTTFHYTLKVTRDPFRWLRDWLRITASTKSKVSRRKKQ
jgi:hypothetical protein